MSTATTKIETKSFLLDLNRRFAAPPERLWRALTEPDQICRWFGPEGTRCGKVAVDLRLGGAWSIECFTGEKLDQLHLFSGVYREIRAPHRLVQTWILPRSRAETLLSFDLEPDGDGTALRLHHEGFPEAEFRDNHEKGWAGSLDKLERL